MKKLHFRAPYEGRRIAGWIAQLEGKSGAYVIRDAASKAVLYVGESHSGNLPTTITRHFQKWTKEGGTTYPRTKVEVACVVTDHDAARALQDRWIRTLSPRDNIIGQLSWWDRVKAVLTTDVPF